MYFCTKISNNKKSRDMKNLIKLVLCLCIMASSLFVFGQTAKYQDIYKVKKKDTIYGIAKKYNITIEDLMRANPDLKNSNGILKADEKLAIPMPSATQSAPVQTAQPAQQAVAVQTQPSAAQPVQAAKAVGGVVKVGVMLPLHNADGDGQRMIEYYRGILMACDSLKHQGINTQVYAWDVPIDANVEQTLADKNAKDCDLIFGPLYTKQVKAIGEFCRKNDIDLVIPFSISGNDVATNNHIFQIYQSQYRQNAEAVKAYTERFRGYHTVIIDCNDTTSFKGPFTTALRKQLTAQGTGYSITNLKSQEDMFAKAFTTDKPNVVVLNTSRSPELNSVFAKLNALKAKNPSVRVSLFGYTEWLMYTKAYSEYYHKYDAYIPTTFYYNPLASKTANLERSYRQWFKSDMRLSLPRFAITGYDHAQFFIRGIHKYGNKFAGTKQQSTYKALQTPLKFTNIQNGGMQNTTFMLVHYKPNRSIESISY